MIHDTEMNRIIVQGLEIKSTTCHETCRDYPDKKDDIMLPQHLCSLVSFIIVLWYIYT